MITRNKQKKSKEANHDQTRGKRFREEIIERRKGGQCRRILMSSICCSIINSFLPLFFFFFFLFSFIHGLQQSSGDLPPFLVDPTAHYYILPNSTLPPKVTDLHLLPPFSLSYPFFCIIFISFFTTFYVHFSLCGGIISIYKLSLLPPPSI